MDEIIEKVTDGGKDTSQDSQEEFTQDYIETLTSQDDLEDNPLQGEQKNKEQPQKTVKTELKKDDEPNPFDFVTTDEKGKTVYDSKAAYDFITAKSEKDFNPEPPIKQPDKSVATATEKKEPTYEENLLTNLKSPLQVYKQYREMGYDEQAAMMMADRDIETNVRNHIQEKTFNERLSKFDEKEKTLEEKARTFELKPKSDSNLASAVRRGGWGSSDRFYKALTDKDLGGGFLAKQFRRENPDKTFKSAEEYKIALNEWFTRFSSDEESLQMAEEYAKAKIFLRNFQKIIENARSTKTKTDAENKESKVKGTTDKQKTASRPIGVSDETLNWLNVKI